MIDPFDIGSFSLKDQRVIEDLVKKQAADFKSSCDKTCELFHIVASSIEFEKTALSSLVQHRVLVEIGGNFLGELIRLGGQPADILAFIKYQQRAMLSRGMTRANAKSPLIEALAVMMDKREEKKL